MTSQPDLSHHMVPHMRDLQPSEMKVIGKMIPEDLGAVSLSGGLPHQSLFPMTQATFSIPPLSSLNGDVTAWAEGSVPTSEVTMSKTGNASASGEVDLSQVFQYGMTNGFPQLIKALTDLTFALHGKPYDEAKLYLSVGSLDILHKCMRMFVEPNVDTILVDEFCYGSGCHLMRSWGAKLHPVKSDPHGLVVEDFRQILETWNVQEQGKKPHILYLVPVGNNPTGAVMQAERYDAIYALCQEHDLLIIEDDPYYHLQFGEYIQDSGERLAHRRAALGRLPAPPQCSADDDLDPVLAAFDSTGIARSFFSRDIDGRVLRLDSVSKCFGPGFRMGWVLCNPFFFDRFIRLAQISTQVTNNWSQAILAAYLSPEHWGIAGFIRWLFGLRLEYQRKRDFFLDCFNKYCPLEVVSTAPCGGAMYQWLTFDVRSHSRYRVHPTNGNAAKEDPVDNTRELMDELYKRLMFEGKVLVMPGFLFVVSIEGENGSDRTNHLRTCFAGDDQTIETGVKALGLIIKVRPALYAARKLLMKEAWHSA